MCIHMRMYRCSLRRTHIHIYICIYTHMHTYICRYIYILACTFTIMVGIISGAPKLAAELDQFALDHSVDIAKEVV